MPFFLSRRRKRAAASTPTSDGGGSSSTAQSNGAAYIKSNKTNKRKKLESTQDLDSKAVHEDGNDVTDNRQQLDADSNDDDSEPLYISSTLLELSEGERSRLLSYIDDNEINNKRQQLLDQQDNYQGGYGQEVNTEVGGIVHSGLVTYYEGLGDSGLATLQKDIATCRLQISNTDSTDSDTYEDESLAADEGDINNTTQNVEDDIRFDGCGDEGGLDELQCNYFTSTPLKLDRAPNGVESDEQSADVVAVVGNGDIAQDDGDFSVDIGSNTSPTTDEDNAPPTTSNLKLDSIKCVERVDDKRIGPSPTNVTANLSSFTKDTSPAFDSSNGSYDQDKDDEDLTSFDDSPAECRESDGLVSPKKGKAFICFVFSFYFIIFLSNIIFLISQSQGPK